MTGSVITRKAALRRTKSLELSRPICEQINECLVEKIHTVGDFGGLSGTFARNHVAHRHALHMRCDITKEENRQHKNRNCRIPRAQETEETLNSYIGCGMWPSAIIYDGYQRRFS
jgi:hypothetical protein